MVRKRKKKSTKEFIKGSSEQIIEKVVYSETVRINIGDYEHRDSFLSYATTQKDGESLDCALKRAKIFVKKSLYAVEKKIRIQSKEFVDFDTMSKLM
ncbi:MAG: hypothetical protein IIC67_11560 [Thaumarchaeota archaeon]|nr:hypothetical protein [Nitrososphaerota archaeon]